MHPSAMLLPTLDVLPSQAAVPPLAKGRTLVTFHPSPCKTLETRLSVMSFNILLGGLRRQALLGYFARLEGTGRMPDIIGLQEASFSIAGGGRVHG
ncbi:hypothetical protein SAMN05443572_106336 [Myxococcus fulvus]|uniref:Endonuclease/exonuclease/phosphatase n=1 Tax=Myxococcus fulvus TaxID=33 RepID=A0A511T4H9_MYXFU|nr:hypothetical protein [Myxococcus fulvus]GEN08238.1 hypothetical protein MFU01_32750 [Myxococcus fulvus]SEU21876.1 hypothetical protein SAMN05443572_106336 [Myxococcus fulvus]